MKRKLFCIGLFKTGTKSFGKAARILGYTVTDKPWFILRDNWYLNPLRWKEYYPIIKQRASKYDAFSDAPWMFLYKELDSWFPESKFVLTLRKDPLTLAKSDTNQWRGKSQIPSINKFIQRYENHNNKILEYFQSKSNFLTMCFELGDGWEKLCNFLNIKKIPNCSFPHLNKGKYRR